MHREHRAQFATDLRADTTCRGLGWWRWYELELDVDSSAPLLLPGGRVRYRSSGMT